MLDKKHLLYGLSDTYVYEKQNKQKNRFNKQKNRFNKDCKIQRFV